MKKNTFLGTLLLMIAFLSNSCSEDEEVNKSLIGKWEYSKKGSIGLDEEVSYLTDYNHNCSSQKDFWEFESKNNTFSSYIYSLENSICDEVQENASFTYSENTKIINFLKSEEIYDIYKVISINSTSLKLQKIYYEAIDPLNQKKSKVEPLYNYFELVRK